MANVEKQTASPSGDHDERSSTERDSGGDVPKVDYKRPRCSICGRGLPAEWDRRCPIEGCGVALCSMRCSFHHNQEAHRPPDREVTSLLDVSDRPPLSRLEGHCEGFLEMMQAENDAAVGVRVQGDSGDTDMSSLVQRSRPRSVQRMCPMKWIASCYECNGRIAFASTLARHCEICNRYCRRKETMCSMRCLRAHWANSCSGPRVELPRGKAPPRGFGWDQPRPLPGDVDYWSSSSSSEEEWSQEARPSPNPRAPDPPSDSSDYGSMPGLIPPTDDEDGTTMMTIRSKLKLQPRVVGDLRHGHQVATASQSLPLVRQVDDSTRCGHCRERFEEAAGFCNFCTLSFCSVACTHRHLAMRHPDLADTLGIQVHDLAGQCQAPNGVGVESEASGTCLTCMPVNQSHSCA